MRRFAPKWCSTDVSADSTVRAVRHGYELRPASTAALKVQLR